METFDMVEGQNKAVARASIKDYVDIMSLSELKKVEKFISDLRQTGCSQSELIDGLSLLPLDEEKLKTVIQEIIKEEQWEGGTLIEYEAIAAGIRRFHKWLCEQKEAKR